MTGFDRVALAWLGLQQQAVLRFLMCICLFSVLILVWGAIFGGSRRWGGVSPKVFGASLSLSVVPLGFVGLSLAQRIPVRSSTEVDSPERRNHAYRAVISYGSGGLNVNLSSALW